MGAETMFCRTGYGTWSREAAVRVVGEGGRYARIYRKADRDEKIGPL